MRPRQIRNLDFQQELTLAGTPVEELGVMLSISGRKLDAKIEGSVALGSMTIFTHTHYKLDVSLLLHGGPNGIVQYALYRRYSQFRRLFEDIEKIYGKEALESAGLIIPEKKIMGAYYSTFKSVVDARTVQLNTFLSTLLAFERIELHECVQQFFDIRAQGTSGPAKELGKNNIIKEALAQVKPGLSSIEFFSSSFIIITKTGYLYVLKSMYDNIRDSILELFIANASVIVDAKEDCRIEITWKTNGNKTIIKLSSQLEQVSWCRAIQDITLNTAVDNNTNKQQASLLATTASKSTPIKFNTKATSGNNKSDVMISRSYDSNVGKQPAVIVTDTQENPTKNNPDYLSTFGL